MRIYYCLTRIYLDNKIPRQNRQNSDISDDYAKVQFLKNYAFTMIEIVEQPSRNYVEYSVDGLSEKEFYFIFDRNGDRKSVKMKQGSINVSEIDRENFVMKLEFSPYKLMFWNPDYKFYQSVKFMRIRNIKNTPNKMITENEKALYTEYLAKINKYMEDNSEKLKNEALKIVQRNPAETSFDEAMESLREKAMDKIKMEMGSSNKVLRQKIADIKDAITFFCSQESIVEIPENSRFIGNKKAVRFVEIDGQVEFHWRKAKPKETWDFLSFDHVEMTHFENVWFEAINLTTLIINECTISDTSETAWKIFSSGISKLQKLDKLTISTNLTDIPDIVFQKLPNSITYLDLRKNRIKSLSSEISNLTHLLTLDLDDNPLLIEIPWKFLPKTIKWLLLENTGISDIPEDIQELTHLSQLALKKTTLKNILWNSLPVKIHSISMQSVQNLREIIYAPQLSSLGIYDTNLKDLGIESILSNLPNITHLTIKNTNLEKFDCTNLWFNNLDLSNNNLTDFSWESLLNFNWNTGTDISVDLSHNKITVLGSPKNWKHLNTLNVNNNHITEILMDEIDINDEEIVNPQMSLNLFHNYLKCLPVGFEKLVGISQLSISKNFFIHENIDKTLWKRLPKSLTVLNLNNLHVFTLPCILKNFTLMKEIYASDCNLHWICPQLSKITSLKYMDISKNPLLKSLSFVPQKPYLYPQIDGRKNIEFGEKSGGVADGIKVPPTEDFTVKPLKILTSKHYVTFKENDATLNVFDGKKRKPVSDVKKKKPVKKNQKEFESFRNTERASAQNLNYNFDPLTEPEPNEGCFCCAKCGEETDKQMIKQLMTMDIDLHQFNDSDVKLENEWNRDLWPAKKWKTVVKTRLCDDCKNWYKNEAKNVVEAHKKKMEAVKESSRTVKRQQNEKERKKKRVKIPAEEEEEEDEESENDDKESEDSILSDDSEGEENIQHESNVGPLTIGSTITVPWPPQNPSYEDPLLPFPLINSVTTAEQPQNQPNQADYVEQLPIHRRTHDNSLQNWSAQNNMEHMEVQHQQHAFNNNAQLPISPPTTFVPTMPYNTTMTTFQPEPYHQNPQNYITPTEGLQLQSPYRHHLTFTEGTSLPYNGYTTPFHSEPYPQNLQNMNVNTILRHPLTAEQIMQTLPNAMHPNYYYQNAPANSLQMTYNNNQTYFEPQHYYNQHQQQMLQPSQESCMISNNQKFNINDPHLMPDAQIYDSRNPDNIHKL